MDREDIQKSLFALLALSIVVFGLVFSVREYARKDANAIREQFNCQVEYEGLKIQQYMQGRTGQLAPGANG